MLDAIDKLFSSERIERPQETVADAHRRRLIPHQGLCHPADAKREAARATRFPDA
jgi:hypothetical protein